MRPLSISEVTMFRSRASRWLDERPSFLVSIRCRMLAPYRVAGGALLGFLDVLLAAWLEILGLHAETQPHLSEDLLDLAE